VAIPDFQTLMRPLLALHADGGEKTQPELRDALAREFELTEEDLAERLPSGTARTFVNRVAWAPTHMKEAGFLVKPRRGISTITERGRAVLREYPERVDMSVLEQFPEYVEFRTRSSSRRRVTQPVTAEHLPVSTSTPEETIDAAYGQVRTALAEELLSRLVERDDRFFEDVVLDVLVALGYGGSKPDAAERVGAATAASTASSAKTCWASMRSTCKRRSELPTATSVRERSGSSSARYRTWKRARGSSSRPRASRRTPESSRADGGSS
jgi:restriction system protein